MRLYFGDTDIMWIDEQDASKGCDYLGLLVWFPGHGYQLVNSGSGYWWERDISMKDGRPE